VVDKAKTPICKATHVKYDTGPHRTTFRAERGLKFMSSQRQMRAEADVDARRHHAIEAHDAEIAT
jgi:hypothetical protein